MEPEVSRPLRVAGFTFNTESVRFCNSKKDPGEKCVQDHFIRRLLDWRMGIADPARDNRPDVIVIALQESGSDSALMNGAKSAFAEALASRGYQAPGDPAIAEALGYGLTTFTKFTTRGLRLGIFVHEGVRDRTALTEPWTEFCGSSAVLDSKAVLRDRLKSKGGLVRSLVIGEDPSVKVTFVDMHLPFTSSSFKSCSERQAALRYQYECFERVYNEVLRRENPDYLFILGDLNFRFSPFEQNADNQCVQEAPQRAPEDTLRLLNEIIEPNGRIDWAPLRKLDELDRLRNQRTLPKEGIDNRGPEFAPTCKMCKGRQASCPIHGVEICYACKTTNGAPGPYTGPGCQSCYATRQGKDERQLGWCDRILYASRTNSIRCTVYDRFDEGSMVLSDHAGVIGMYDIDDLRVQEGVAAPVLPRLFGRL